MAYPICRQCGSLGVAVRWHRYGWRCLFAGVLPVAFGAHLHARCASCGFHWRLP